MQLDPVDKSRLGYKGVDSAGRNISSWGAGVFKVAGEDKYHMYVDGTGTTRGLSSRPHPRPAPPAVQLPRTHAGFFVHACRCALFIYAGVLRC